MVQRCILYVLGFSILFSGIGQEDSVLLDEIRIVDSYLSKYAEGSGFEVLNITNKSGSVDEVLRQQSSMYFKKYGNNQLSTISFRGTSAVHTNVMWHGIPVNSATLGQTDFSQWPVWLISSLSIQPGSSGALYGSGSVGGSVFIDDFEMRRENNSVQIMTEAGSFGLRTMAGKLSYGRGNWRSRTAVINSIIKNNFPFQEKGTGISRRQSNASAATTGVSQKLQYQGQYHRWSSDFMYVLNDRDVQPPATNLNSDDHLRTSSLRLASEHLYEKNDYSLSTTLGFIGYKYNFNGEITRSNQLSVVQRYQKSLNRGLDIQTGYVLNHARGFSAYYKNDPISASMDGFVSTSWRPTGFWDFTFGLRQAVFEGILAPLSPSLAIKRKLLDDKFHWSARYSRGFRFPTLNDRYWSPGGNKDLTHEKSHELETSLKYEIQVATSKIQWKLNLFRIWSTDWILWLPNDQGVWSPDNMQEVEITGLESEILWKSSGTSLHWESVLRYNYSLSRNKSDLISPVFINNQLPYVPFHTGTWMNTFQLGSWQLDITQTYTGERFTTLDNSESVADFYLLDLSMRQRFAWWKSMIAWTFSVINVLDQSYENIRHYAMPGRHYQFKLLINL